MNRDTAFFLEIGFVPVNKFLKIKGSGNQTIRVRSLLLDPWFFRLPAFGRMFHTHIFAPGNIESTFLAEGYRMLCVDSFRENVFAFFDDCHNDPIHRLDRRKDAHAANRMSECTRKALFMDHFLVEEGGEEVTIQEIQGSLYQPLPEDLPMDRYLCLEEYRFQQFLRYLVGLRFLALAFSRSDLNLDLSFHILEKMSSRVQSQRLSA